MRLFHAAPLFAAALLFAVPAAAAQKPADIKAETFAQLPSVQLVALSPDASYLAYTGSVRGVTNLILRPLEKGGKPVAIPPVDETAIAWFHWINNHRLIVAYRYTEEVGEAHGRTALFSIDVNKPGYVDMARDPKQRDRNPYIDKLHIKAKQWSRDNVIDFLPEDPEHFLLAIDSNFDGRAEVRKVDVETGHYTNVTEGYDWIGTWVTDQSHRYRLGWGLGPDGAHMVYIDPDTNTKHDLVDIAWHAKHGIEPLAFTADPHIAYALEPHGPALRKRLITFDVLKGKRVDVLYENPDVDVENVVKDPKTDAVIGVAYIDDLPRVHYFDKDLASLQAQFDKMLGGGSNVIATMNRAKGIFIVKHTSDREDTFYMVDMKTGRVNVFARTVPVPPNELAPTMKQMIKARDGLEIPTYLTLPKGVAPSHLPMVVYPHGGPHERTTEAYYFITQFLASRGYAVLRPNFRGSSGYGYPFMKAGQHQWGGKMQDDVTDVTKWAISQGIADPKRVCIVGGSYGGYAAYMGVIKEPGLYACAVSFNGVSDLVAIQKRFRTLLRIKRYAKTLTPENGDTETVSPLQQADKVSAPVLIFHVENDSVVPFEESVDMYKKLKKLGKPVKMVKAPSGDHFLLTEQARVAFLKPLESFLKKELGQ